MESAFLLRLCIMHVLGDFVLQPDSWVRQRGEKHFRSPKLYLHGLVQTALAGMVLPEARWWWMALVIGAGHVVFDGWKAWRRANGAGAFVLDQCLHFGVILLCWQVAASPGIGSQLRMWANDPQVLAVTLGYALVIFLYPRLIAIATARWRQEIPQNRQRLVAAGRWIGIMERMLVLTFILIGQWAAIGFLLGAKSILRIGDLREPADKSQTEYILIGTLLSFTLTIGTGIVVQMLTN